MNYALITVLLLASASAWAAEIDFSTPIRTLDEKTIPLCDKDTPDCKAPTTLAVVASQALLAPDDPRQGTSAPDDKVRAFALALKVHAGAKLNLTAEDIALIKKRIGAAYAPLVVGRAFEILDPPGLVAK